MRGLITRFVWHILSHGFFADRGRARMTFKVVSVTSNSSGLINLSDHGVNTSNSYGVSLICTTSNYRLSNPILWSNGNYYTVLTAWNNVTPVANTRIGMIITWFYGA